MHSGIPFDLLKWQLEDIVKPLFGTKKADGTRQYKRCSIWCPKKVGKSTLCAGLALYMLLGDGESSPEVYIIASTVAEASNVFNQAASFIKANQRLSSVLKINNHLKTISIKQGEGFIQVLSGDRPAGKFGVNASCVIGDEVGHHSPFQRAIWADLQYAGSARRQPIQITISTSSFDLQGFGYELFKEARQTLDNPQHDPTMLPVIFAAPLDADPFDPEVWKQCCPSLGETISLQDYEDEARRAKNNPRLLDEFQTYRLCQWRSAASTWIPHHIFSQCKQDVREETYYGRTGFVGLDAGSKHDLFAYCLLIPDGDKVVMFPRAFIPRDNAQRKETQDGVRYSLWEKEGFIYLTEGDIVDPRFVKERILEDCANFSIRELGFDKACGAELLMLDLRDNHGVNTCDVSQSMPALSSATHYFEQLVYSKKLVVPDNPVLDWCVNNCQVKRRKDMIHLDKDKVSQRIDLVTAAVIGLNRVIANPVSDFFCVWV